MLRDAAIGVSTRSFRLLQMVRRPHMLLLMPLLVLSAFYLGGQAAMIFVALAFPVALAVALPEQEAT